MMNNISDAEEFSYSPASTVWERDSVVGTNIMQLDDSSRSADSGAPLHKRSISAMSLLSIPSHENHDESSCQLLNIIKTESATHYEVTPNYLHSSALTAKQPPKESKDQGVR